ncbi:MAG: cytochrome P450 [Nocardioides sp.]|nr:cytochrome P450 [Nocardioides sp.]
MSRVAVARFFAGLYVDKAARVYAAKARGDLPARLALRPGQIDPYPLYEQIRARGTFVTNRFGNLVTADHAVCDEILRSREFGVARASSRPDVARGDSGMSMLGLNPPDHTRLRRLAAPAFGPRQIAGFRELVADRAAALADELARAGESDFVESFATPLPIAIISTLLGVPEEMRGDFKRHGEVIGSGLSGVRGVRHAQALIGARRGIDDIFKDLIDLRRQEPGDDVVSRLLSTDLTRIEMLAMCRLLLVAGFETTVNALGNAMLAFAAHPEQWERLVADPSLAASATEEVLRYDSPVQRTDRFAQVDTEVVGVAIEAGQNVTTLLGAANRDPGVFADPAAFDIARDNAGAHLSFSSGIHYCLGQPLARMETAVALETLATRLPGLRVTDRPTYRRGVVLRGPLRLPVSAR